MAKVKGMAATRYIGKLGPQVFYMRDGQNVVRELAAQVSNPQTNAQMNQRIKFGNLIALYRLNKQWMEKCAFPLRPATQSVYNAFMSVNLAANEVYLTKEMYQSGIVVLEPIDFTKGNLPQQLLEYDNDVSFVSNLVMGSGEISIDSVAALTRVLLDNNAWLREGDQLSIIFNTTDRQNYGRMFAAECTLDLSDTNPIEESRAAAFAHMYNISSDGYMAFAMDNLPDSVYDGAEVIGAVFVVSRKTSSGIEVTTSRMELNTYDVLNTFNTDRARAAARYSYGAGGGEPFLTPGYNGTMEPIEYATIVVNNTTGGTILLNGEAVQQLRVPVGSVVGLAVIEDDDYQFENFIINGESSQAGSLQPTEATTYTISAVFAQTE